jgi:hypothetical protein
MVSPLHFAATIVTRMGGAASGSVERWLRHREIERGPTVREGAAKGRLLQNIAVDTDRIKEAGPGRTNGEARMRQSTGDIHGPESGCAGSGQCRRQNMAKDREPTQITLAPGDGAIVVREDGTFNMFLPQMDEEESVPENIMLMIGFSLALGQKDERLYKLVEQIMSEQPESRQEGDVR